MQAGNKYYLKNQDLKSGPLKNTSIQVTLTVQLKLEIFVLNSGTRAISLTYHLENAQN